MLQQGDAESFIFLYLMKKLAHKSRSDSSFSSQNALHPLQPVEGLALPFADILGKGGINLFFFLCQTFIHFLFAGLKPGTHHFLCLLEGLMYLLFHADDFPQNNVSIFTFYQINYALVLLPVVCNVLFI
jgi:hypothetical protein